MADKYELTEQQKRDIQEAVKDQMNHMGEIFSQCWESDEFKEAFMKDPKAIFKEYGVNYNEEKEYVIIDSPDKTIVHVLPHDGIKEAIDSFSQMLAKKVEDLDDNGGRQILLDGWKYEIYQNTPDKFYIAIPPSPENLSPEELEMVNGGCLFMVAFFVFVSEAVSLATTIASVAELAVVLEVVVGAAEALLATTTLAVVAEGWTVVLTVYSVISANESITGYFITADASSVNTNATVAIKPS